MSELMMLDVVWPNLKNLIKDGPCHGSKAMTGHRIPFDTCVSAAVRSACQEILLNGPGPTIPK
jgi:hypothetical protein